jgi:hypothetical protein
VQSVNNHYAGFGPGTANIFRKTVGLPEVVWNKEYENKNEGEDTSYLHNSSIQDPKQSTISDFMA